MNPMEDKSASKDDKLMHSVDNMNQTLHITRRWAWIVLCALLLITLAILLSIFFVRVPTHITTQGYSDEGTVICYVNADDVDELEVGQEVLVDREFDGKITTISHAVYSTAEAEGQVKNDYARHLLEIPAWSVRLEISCDGQLDDEAVHPVVITTGEVSLSTFFIGAGQ